MAAKGEQDDLAIWHELEELLCQVATGRIPNRAEATLYSDCRSNLLASRLRPALPGFLYQCISLFKFKDFITLYDPSIERRESFVREAFARNRLTTGFGNPQPTRRTAPEPMQWVL